MKKQSIKWSDSAFIVLHIREWRTKERMKKEKSLFGRPKQASIERATAEEKNAS